MYFLMKMTERDLLVANNYNDTHNLLSGYRFLFLKYKFGTVKEEESVHIDHTLENAMLQWVREHRFVDLITQLQQITFLF